MSKTRYSIQTARSCFRTWRNAPRMLVLLGMISCFTIIYVIPFAENAKAMGETLQITEAFTAMLNWRFSMLLFSTSILLLFGDLPIIENFTGNALVKGSRKGWMIGQMIYVVATSFLLTLFIFAISVLVCLPNIHISDEWSKPVKLLALNGRIAISPERIKLPFQKSIIRNYTPWIAFAHSFSLFYLMGCFYGLATLALRMRFKTASFILLMLVNTVSWAMGMFDASMKAYAVLSMLSIHYHASLYLHGYMNANSMLPTLGISYITLCGLMILFIVFSFIFVRKYDYMQMEAEHT